MHSVSRDFCNGVLALLYPVFKEGNSKVFLGKIPVLSRYERILTEMTVFLNI